MIPLGPLSNVETARKKAEDLVQCLKKVKNRQQAEQQRTMISAQEGDEGLDPIREAIVDEMNMKFAVLEQPTFLIIEEEGNGKFSLDKKGSFRDRFHNQRVTLGDGKERSKADIFLESSRRRTFRKIVMTPSKQGHYEENGARYFNLWHGFAYIPRVGNCEKFKQHTLRVICSGNEELYNYVMNLLANWVQKPEERTVAILLRGPQGCGKNIWAEAIGALFGPAFGVYDDVERLLGRFNADLATKLLILADEAFWGGRRSDSGKLKAAITSESFWLEGKGKDKVEIKNYRKWIAASNERFALPLDVDDRRWLVLDCSGHRAQDIGYFSELTKELEGGGRAALLQELLDRDISHFQPRILPVNDNAFDMKLKSSPSFIRYLYEALNHGRFNLEASAGFEWGESSTDIRSEILRLHYREYCKSERVSAPQGDEECGVLLNSLFKTAGFKKSRRRWGGVRQMTYSFPPLSQCRTQFAGYIGASVKKIFLNEEEEDS